jgi:hypothetical protein
MSPPTAAIASVSPARSHSDFAGIGEAIAAINAAAGERRQTEAARQRPEAVCPNRCLDFFR